MPRAGMSAKTIVRARRQWALRRARRREGPNEANQLELGGGSAAGPGIGEAWVETVVKVATVAGKDGAAGAAEGGEETKYFGSGGDHVGGSGVRSGGTGGGGDGGGVVALLVSSPFSLFPKLLRTLFFVWKFLVCPQAPQKRFFCFFSRHVIGKYPYMACLLNISQPNRIAHPPPPGLQRPTSAEKDMTGR